MESLSKLIYFMIFFSNLDIHMAEEDNKLMIALEDKLETKLSEYTNYVAQWLEDFNDKHLGNSELGRLLHYEDLKTKFSGSSARKSKSMKKMGMAMMPVIFHVGATSTWMLLTSILAAKSVAIGLVLLVFKIAVSSAKVASFFTTLKAKQGHHHEYSWTPHVESHGYARSLPGTGSYYPVDWKSLTPEVSDTSPPYKTIPAYKHLDFQPSIEDPEFIEDTKPHS